MQEAAQRLKSLRESVGVSQAKLAALMGATQASVNRYENGQSSPPLKILRWYADFFDVSLDYIFARTEQPEGKLYEHKPKVWKLLHRTTRNYGSLSICALTRLPRSVKNCGKR